MRVHACGASPHTWLGQDGFSYPVEVPAWSSLTRIPAGDGQAVGQDLHAHVTGREGGSSLLICSRREKCPTSASHLSPPASAWCQPALDGWSAWLGGKRRRAEVGHAWHAPP